jgi:hypothetical protein
MCLPSPPFPLPACPPPSPAGLSGSGKSTVACTLEHLLHERGHFTSLLDGDNIRHGLNKDLGFRWVGGRVGGHEWVPGAVGGYSLCGRAGWGAPAL